MKEELITFETAKLAKEKGFDSKYTEDYDTLGFVQQRGILESHNLERVSAPTQSLLQKWLREQHNLEVISMHADDFVWWKVKVRRLSKVGAEIIKTEMEFNTYEEALESGLHQALKLI